MKVFAQQVGLSLRLNFRNRMAIIYGFLFPMIFLGAFWALYRHDRVPLALHMGELLTVTILGGACMGMPTTMVGERERGVWRRYRLAPVRTASLIATVVTARYALLLTAALIQLGIAMAAGMPLPGHPLGLLIAFTFVAFAFLGMGLEIAMLADNVPAVQALGQCIFLPMLIIGGIAVNIGSLPDWAQHLSAFFPGRYAVRTLQSCVTGHGLGSVQFDLLAMSLTGLAGGAAAIGMFRWDPKQRLSVRNGKVWVVVALAAWAVVGVLAEARGVVFMGRAVSAKADTGTTPDATTFFKSNPPLVTAPAASALKAVAPSATPPHEERTLPEPASWEGVTPEYLNQIAYERLPDDGDVVTPVAKSSDEPDPSMVGDLQYIATELPQWGPAGVKDPVQRARNLLYVAAVPDVLQMESMEAFIPPLIFDRLRKDVPSRDLPGILYWIATHPSQGSDTAVHSLDLLGLPNGPENTKTVRERVAIYALKLLGRITGKIEQK